MSHSHQYQKLVLASASPRRSELLRAAGIHCIIDPAHIPEELKNGEAPIDGARRLAREKALAVRPRHEDSFILGADTIVVLDGTVVLGKPRDARDADTMLHSLSGRTHAVITGICLIAPNGTMADDAAVTQVTMSTIRDQEIRDYIATGEPMDKAGAYAIQGIASRYVTKIEGDYSNVVGLPVPMAWKMLRENGW